MQPDVAFISTTVDVSLTIATTSPTAIDLDLQFNKGVRRVHIREITWYPLEFGLDEV